MKTTVINATEYRNVSLSLLSESKTNRRRIFEDAALKEFSESVRRSLYPTHVRGRGLGRCSFITSVFKSRLRNLREADLPR
jgi:ParB family chromosome partitioning protein